VAVAIPVAIHLLHRGRSRPIPFSNLQFLRALHQSRMRKLRLRQWLVLLLRTLAVAFMVLAFSRPSHRAGGNGLFGGSPPATAVILLDNSYSTRYREPGGRLFDQLQQRVGELLELYDERDDVVLIPFADRAEVPIQGEGSERLREHLAELTPSDRVTDIGGALAAAEELLSGLGEERARELFLVTDLASYNWSATPPRGDAWLPDVQVYGVVPSPADRPNLALDSLSLDPWLQAPGRKLTLQAGLANASPRPVSASADLFVDGERVQRREVSLAAGERLAVEFAFVPRGPGRLRGYVELTGDDLPLDDRRYFTLHVPAEVNVLLVGHRSVDTYYPRTALAAAAATDPVLQVRAGLLSELDEGALAGTHVLVLCNLVRLDRETTRRVRGFAAAGGSIVIFPGPTADLSFLNRHLLPDLVPTVLKGVSGTPGAADAHLTLDRERPHHALLDRLLAATATDPPRFWAFFEMVPAQQLEPLLLFDGGGPAVVEGRSPGGRAILFASPLSLDWNDLPLRGLFAPLIHRLTRYLVLPPDHATRYAVGAPVRRRVPGLSADDAVQVETPSGRRLFLEPQHDSAGVVWKVPHADEAGFWRLLRDGDEVDVFAVNVDAREADLTVVSDGLLDRLLGPGRVRFLGPDEDLAEAVLAGRYGRELWRECLALAVCLLLLELWIARAPSRRRSTETPPEPLS